MRHRRAGTKLSRTASHRNAMFRNMVTSLFKYDQIRTTDAKAKELRRWADQLVTLAKRGDLHARRQAMAIIREKDVVHKLFAEAPQRFADVNGGYTRVVKIGFRPGDAAPESIVQLVTPQPKKKKKPRRKKKAAAAAATPSATPKSAAVEPTSAAEGEAAPDTEAQAEAADAAEVSEAPEAQAETAPETVDAQSADTPAPEAEDPPAAEETEAGDAKEK